MEGKPANYDYFVIEIVAAENFACYGGMLQKGLKFSYDWQVSLSRLKTSSWFGFLRSNWVNERERWRVARICDYSNCRILFFSVGYTIAMTKPAKNVTKFNQADF